MKLGTLKDGTRDGKLVVVSKDLTRAVVADAVAGSLLAALEAWPQNAPRLQQLYGELNGGRLAAAFELDTSRLAAPLPRAPQWLDGSAFHSHGDLMEKVFGHQPIEGKRQIPLMYQGASDDFIGPRDDMPLPSEADGMDFEAEIGVIVDYVPMATPADQALRHVKLLVLLNDASLRVLAGREVKTGFGFLQSKPATSFAPVAVTPDELGASWRDGRVHLPVRVEWNREHFGAPDAGQMGFGFHDLIAHAARTRNLHPGTIIGSGTISNSTYRTVGSACIAERRGIETVDHGKASTAYMKFGDTVRIEMLDAQGASVFGSIDQRMVQASVFAQQT
ncbi:MAG TPA: fumarylacetoacetate hydrolase family protein [Steroidobacteraceae bacterium]